jgi:uncharacterized membrane protein YphA (DoxX/SURF4 family)
MRIAVNIVRIFVGLLFILSGLVKANDPLGLSYKMQEFFEVWNASLNQLSFFAKDALISTFHFFHEHSLALSIIMITLEIIAGVALWIGWRKKFVLNLLLLLIIFFTFLTAYAYWSGKFKSCGCFGDCIPITPMTSFLKDVLLLVLIGFLIAFQRYIQPLFTSRINSLIMLGSLILTLAFQWYVLTYLPVVDCLPFKKGNNISEQMKIPPNAIQDSFAMKFIYKKDDKEYEFSPTELPVDLDQYTFVDRVQKLIRKGNAEPPIKGFSLNSTSGEDATQQVLEATTAIILFIENFQKNPANWIDDFKAVYERAKQKNITTVVATADPRRAEQYFASQNMTELPVYSTDNTAVKTAARTNPTIFLLKQGTVIEKLSYRQMDQLIPKL